MRRNLTIVVAALAAALALVPAAAQARGSHHKASASDRNGDRIPDRWEKRNHLSLKVKQTKRDQDRDGLNNLGEFKSGTNPRDRDSDDDGVRDGAEHRFGMNPRDDDSDNDGVEDGEENAGKVQSFDGTTLTILLTSGGTVTGKVVTGVTEIECRTATATATSSRHGDENENEAGDDNRGQGENSGPGKSGDDNDDNDNNDENENEHEGNCTSADLTPNTVVREAELQASDGGATFREVKLVK